MRKTDHGKREPLHLEEFERKHICLPFAPELSKIVHIQMRTIYVNTAARPGAKIIRLIAGEEERA